MKALFGCLYFLAVFTIILSPVTCTHPMAPDPISGAVVTLDTDTITPTYLNSNIFLWASETGGFTSMCLDTNSTERHNERSICKIEWTSECGTWAGFKINIEDIRDSLPDSIFFFIKNFQQYSTIKIKITQNTKLGAEGIWEIDAPVNKWVLVKIDATKLPDIFDKEKLMEILIVADNNLPKSGYFYFDGLANPAFISESDYCN